MILVKTSYAQIVLTFPNVLAASEIVSARFMTNLIFNDSLKGVFSFPKEVEGILYKMQVELFPEEAFFDDIPQTKYPVGRIFFG